MLKCFYHEMLFCPQKKSKTKPADKTHKKTNCELVAQKNGKVPFSPIHGTEVISPFGFSPFGYSPFGFGGFGFGLPVPLGPTGPSASDQMLQNQQQQERNDAGWWVDWLIG